jgi:hypothetical protein
MPHTKRTPVPSALMVRLGTPVEQEFWTQYFKASLAELELAMAAVGNNDRAIGEWLKDHRRGQHDAAQVPSE